MGYYSKYIYPRIVERILSTPQVTKYRKETLADVKGEILEIGFGTGLNLACYPRNVIKITAIDTNEGMNAVAQKRAERSGINVDIKTLNAEGMPFKSNTFDTVVSTFTFCTIGNINKALKEIYRVLKPNGRLVFLEHGLSNDKNIRKLQNSLNPIYLLVSEGCNLNRDIKEIIENNKFEISELEQFPCERMIKILSYFYKGIAIKGI